MRESLGPTENQSRQMAFCPKAQTEIKYDWMWSPFHGLELSSERDVIKVKFTGSGTKIAQEQLEFSVQLPKAELNKLHAVCRFSLSGSKGLQSYGLSCVQFL